MADIFSKKKRSKIMSKVTGKNTKPELTIRKALFSEGYRYRLHRKDLPGNPDIVFPIRKKVLFINGCFWHSHNCKKAALPETNRFFWENKLSGNAKRDRLNISKLKKMGWSSMVIWQCKINKSTLKLQINKIKKYLE